MRFAPMTEDEAAKAAGTVWDKGEYDAIVETAVEKVSRANGNDMIELTLIVYGPAGTEKRVRDWLVATDGGQAKIQRFAKSADLWSEYLNGDLRAESCQNRNVVVKLGIEKAKDDYPARNKVSDYIPTKAAEPSPTKPDPKRGIEGVSPQQRNAAGTGRTDPTKPPTDDEIPF